MVSSAVVRTSVRTRARAALAPALLLLLTAGFFWKIALTSQFTWMDHPDMLHQVLPWYQFQAREWHAGRLPLWDPYVWGGQPLVGQVQPGAAYPLNWVLFLLPLNQGHIARLAMNWYFVFIHYLGALFCYWLCRDLGRTRTASLAAGAAFGFGGYVGTTEWPQLVNGAVWAPLVFLFSLRALRGERPVANAALSGAFLGVSYLGGHHQIPVLVSVALAGAWLYNGVRLERGRLRWALAAAVLGLQTLAAGALQILPAYEYGKLALRWVGSQNPVFWDQYVPYSVHAQYSLFPLSVLGIVFPGIHRNADPFIGLVVVSLALAAVSEVWREPAVRFFGAILLAALFFALGGYSVFHGVMYAVVPMVEKARYPAMAVCLFHLGIAVLAAFGIDAWREPAVRNGPWALRVIRALAVIGLFTYAVLFALSRFRPQQGAEYEQAAVAALVAVSLAALLYAWRRESIRTPLALPLLFLLLLFELGTVTGSNYLHRESPGSLHALEENGDIVRYLRSVPQPVRLEVNEQQSPINFGDWHGVEQFRAYTALSENVAYIQGEPLARRLFGLNYYLGRKPARESQVEVFRGQSGLNLYRNPEVLPRVWTVHEAQTLAGKADILPTLRRAGFDPGRQVFLRAPAPKLDACAGADKVQLLAREPGRVVIDTEMACRGMVVLGDTYFPGWEAAVDGVPAPIYAAFTVVRGVVAGAGRHRIEFRYRPLSVYVGGILTLAGLLGALIAAGTGRRPKEPGRIRRLVGRWRSQFPFSPASPNPL